MTYTLAKQNSLLCLYFSPPPPHPQDENPEKAIKMQINKALKYQLPKDDFKVIRTWYLPFSSQRRPRYGCSLLQQRWYVGLVVISDQPKRPIFQFVVRRIIFSPLSHVCVSRRNRGQIYLILFQRFSKELIASTATTFRFHFILL